MTQRRNNNKKQQKVDVKKSSDKKQGVNGKKSGKASKPDSAEDLDAALMKYMGHAAAQKERQAKKDPAAQKEALESQLDAYFSKPDESSA